MTVAINPRREKESTLDILVKGLAVTKSITGVGVDLANLKSYYDTRSDRENNVVDAKTMVEHGQNFSASPTPSEGAIQVGIRSKEGIKQTYLTPKDKSPTIPGQMEYVKFLATDGAKEVAPGTKGSILVPHRDANGVVVQSSVLLPDKSLKATADQSKAALFGKRMEQSEQVFTNLTNEGFDPTTYGAQAQKFSLYPEGLKSNKIKQQEQAERNFVNAILRRESGSAISPSEFQSAEKQYFPRVGDDPDTLKQKAENRALAREGLKAESGPAWGQVSIEKAKSSVAHSPSARGSKMSLIPEAQAGGQKFNAEDVAAMGEARRRYMANPNDQTAIKAMQILKAKGLR